MRVAIRTDAASHIGAGHVMRCLTLANALKAEGAEVSFVCRLFAGHLGKRINAEGHHLQMLPSSMHNVESELNPKQPPDYAAWLGESWETDLTQTQIVLGEEIFDWLVVDHYSLDVRWERAMRKFFRKIMIIDDLANRIHDCDLLLDQNLHKPGEKHYSGLVPGPCKLLLGTRFALLRPEFSETGKKLRVRDGFVRRIFIYFGAADSENLTGRALEGFKTLGDEAVYADVVVGEANPHRDDINRKYGFLKNVILHGRVDNIAQLMSQADLAIGAGGTTTWERCVLGLPTLIVSIAPNQDCNAERMDSQGAALFLGKSSQVKEQHILDGIQKCLRDKSLVFSMSEKSSELVDGGGCGRVIAEMNLS